MHVPAMRHPRASVLRVPEAVFASLIALVPACNHDGSVASSAAAHDGSAAVDNAAPRVGLGEVMVQVGRRFEVVGRATVAKRFELAEFEVGELEELFEGDVPRAELPKEGPTAHIPMMARAFLKTNLPQLKKAAASHDPKTFELAFQQTAAACNSCHQASAKGFIEIPSVPGRGVPVIEAETVTGGEGPKTALPAADTAIEAMAVRAVPLPGSTAPAALDYIACESPSQGSARVWVPAGGSGSVDVFDTASGAFRRVDGFVTAVREHNGQKRVVGPSSVAIGEGFAYVGNRAVNEVCAIDVKTLARGACLTMHSGVDGVAWVATTHQVWVTTPSDGSVVVLDAAADGTLKVADTVQVGGEPEGYAVDEPRGLFLTNLEDKAKTVVVDVRRRAVKATWDNKCGAEGPRGIAVDSVQNLVMVACTDRIEVLDGAHDGASLGSIETGTGVDNIDYSSARQTLYVAAGKAARLTAIHVGPKGELTVTGRTDTRDGARNAVIDGAGNVYIADPKGATLLVASPRSK